MSKSQRGANKLRNINMLLVISYPAFPAFLLVPRRLLPSHPGPLCPLEALQPNVQCEWFHTILYGIEEYSYRWVLVVLRRPGFLEDPSYLAHPVDLADLGRLKS